jgi:hypothetical protein
VATGHHLPIKAPSHPVPVHFDSSASLNLYRLVAWEVCHLLAVPCCYTCLSLWRCSYQSAVVLILTFCADVAATVSSTVPCCRSSCRRTKV